MARERKAGRRDAGELEGQPDPRAPLDGARFLAAARPVLARLAEDLLARVDASPAVAAAVAARHAAEVAARRTADPLAVWRASFVDQVAAAWLLSCVFARVLEDRGLVAAARLAGPGASDSQRLFFEVAPSLSERDYLLMVFRELARFPAARDLFDARHNPVWLLTPSADAAKALLALFRLPSADAPAFRFGQADTRFLGDLYQDLNESVQKRYALLQTPRFVESFILDRTLDRAIDRFGLDDTTIIDPTCGSGHFLLGAVGRLFDRRLAAEPGLDPRQAAARALDAVYGADINPYAVAIARFRLTLAVLEKGGYTRLADAPALPLHLVVADSLLHNAQLEQKTFLELDGQSAAVWGGEELALEDESAARAVLHRRYAAVVGNPPYITVKDSVLRERYREMYVAAAGKYAVAAPFTQRFFQLARAGGAVGMITANSFMKREFGKALIEQFLPTVNLDLVVNTSGAYIPGHGTPTVLLFGTAEAPTGSDVLAVLAKRGEPTTPDDPEQGLVWRSIAEHWQDATFENDYVSGARVPRGTLSKYPWSLGGGGVSELKELIEDRCGARLRDVVDDVGFASFTGLDDAFMVSASAAPRLGLGTDIVRPMVIGECVRDWAANPEEVAIVPYDLRTQQPLALNTHSEWAKFLWHFRTVASNVASFGGKTRAEEGQSWWHWYRWQSERYLCPFRITFAFVATHNHFVLDRGGKVFNRSAPIIKLPETATEDDHLALLAYLNSSTACFWMKQVFQPKSSIRDVGDTRDKPERTSYEFTGTGLLGLPIPTFALAQRAALIRLGMAASTAAEQREALSGAWFVREHANGSQVDDAATVEAKRANLLCAMVTAQEEIDWIVYTAFGLAAPTPEGSEPARPDDRPFLAGEGSRHSNTWRERAKVIASSAELPIIEHVVYKRPWLGRQGVFGHSTKSFDEEVRNAASAWLQDATEKALGATPAPQSRGEIARGLGATGPAQRVAKLIDPEGLADQVIRSLALDEVPFLAILSHTDAGLVKRAAWEQTWALQRREDAGEKVGEIPVPPRYDVKDFRDQSYWSLRGKLDVPKERFISYPGCESDEDGEPVYGWAGWNHLERAQALAALYQKRKNEEAWGKERLTPMLAGLLELLPWVVQWHNEPSDEYGGMRLGDFFDGFLDGECRALGLTRDDLRAWRPAEKRRGGKAKAKAVAPATAEAEGEPAPKKKRGRKAGAGESGEAT